MQNKAQDGYFEDTAKNFPRRKPGEILGLFSLPFLVLGLLFSCSWLALVFGSEMPLEDTRSQIAVDYSVWDDLKVQPVGLGIIQEVETDRKDGVELGQILAPEEEGWFWWTPAATEGVESGTATMTPSSTNEPSVSPAGTLSEIETATITITGTKPTATITDTSTPSATNTPATASVTATATRTPTFTASSTATPRNTATPTRIPTFTGTSTPTPSQTPSSDCTADTLTKFKGTGRFIQWRLNNYSSVPFTLDALALSWPILNGNLIKITLGGETIWSGADAPQEIDLGPGDWFLVDRTVPPNSSERLEITFEDIAISTGYETTLFLSVPCSYTINN